MKKYRAVIVLAILIGFAILYYFNFEANKKTVNDTAQSEATEVSKIINKDLVNDYPKTPREVVRLYSRIITCFYGEEYSEEEKKAISLQARLLMDAELLEKNPFDTYYEDLTAEIKSYKTESRRISTYIIANSSDIEYKSFQLRQYAKVDCIYYMKSKSGTERTIETYTLRKDESGNWKILFWTLKPMDEENE